MTCTLESSVCGWSPHALPSKLSSTEPLKSLQVHDQGASISPQLSLTALAPFSPQQTWRLQHWDSQAPVRWGSALVRTQPPPGFMLLFAFSIILGLTILFILYYVFICLRQCHDTSDQSFSKYVSPKVYVMKWEFCTEQQWLWEWKGHWLASNASFLQYFGFWRSLWGCNFLPFPGLYLLCLWAFYEVPEGLAQLLRLCGVA